MEGGAEKEKNAVRMFAFVVRCSGAATVAYALASLLGLPQAVWAAISAIVVSQDQLQDTRASLTTRILGTLFGVVVTVVVSALGSEIALPAAAQMTTAIAVTALVAYSFPNLRVAMWTCPIVLLTTPPEVPIAVAGLHRGGEVVLGAMVGGVFHWAAEFVVGRLAVGPLLPEREE